MKKGLLKFFAIFLTGMAGGIFSEQIFWPYFVERPLFYEYNLEGNPVYLSETRDIYIQENTALQEAAEKAEGVVAGVLYQSGGKTKEGSALIVTSDGLAVTLASIMTKGAAVYVDGKPCQYQVLKRDTEKDLALLKLDKTNLPTLGFADLSKAKKGERVFLVSVVFEQGLPVYTVNSGIVRRIDESGIITNIQGEDALGSPLFNIKGEVLGLNSLGSQGEASAISLPAIKAFVGL